MANVLVIAEQANGAMRPCEIDDLGAVGAAIDEIAEEHEAVIRRRVDEREQLSQFGVAAMDVADGDESPVHAVEKC